MTMLINVASFAQDWGDNYISGAIGFSGGSQSTSLSDGRNSYSEYQPLNSSFAVGLEYAYFFKNNLRIGICLNTEAASSPSESTNYGWLKTKALTVGINPNLAYHLQLTDNFYYTPEIGVSLDFGSMKEQLTGTDLYKYPVWGCSAYAHLLAFEFKASEKIALGISMCTVSYMSIFVTDNATDYSLTTNQLNFALNDASINFRYYFW